MCEVNEMNTYEREGWYIAGNVTEKVCGEIIWVHNTYLNKDVPAICQIPYGVEHMHDYLRPVKSCR